MNFNPEPAAIRWIPYGNQSPLINFLKSYHDLSPEIEEVINNYTFPVTFTRKRHIASPLHKNRYLFYILKGSAHGFIKERNQKITAWIAVEGDFVGTITNFLDESSSEEYIEAIEPILAIAVPHEMSIMLYQSFPESNYIGRLIIEQYYKRAVERALIARLPSAKLKYYRFLKSYKHLNNRIALKYIASFLGMRVETLSRIRSGKFSQ